MPEKINDTLKKALMERAPDKRITCQEARQVAEEAAVEYSVVGAACDALKIRIHSCGLGCF